MEEEGWRGERKGWWWVRCDIAIPPGRTDAGVCSFIHEGFLPIYNYSETCLYIVATSWDQINWLQYREVA